MLLVLLLLLLEPLEAQVLNNSLEVQQEVSHFSYMDDALSNNVVYNVHATEERVYAATQNGITVITNGKSKILRSKSARSNSFSLFKTDPKGELYVMNFQSQVFKVTQDSITLYKDFKHAFETRIYSYFFLENYLYANSKEGIKRFEIETLKEDGNFSEKWLHKRTFEYESRQIGDSVIIGSHILYDDGLIGSDDNKNLEVCFLEEVTKAKVTYRTPLFINSDSWLFLDNGNLLNISDCKVERFNLEVVPTRIYNEGIIDGFIWAATDKGLVLVEKDGFKNAQILLKDIPCSHVVKDNQGTWWVATLGQGLKVIPELSSFSSSLENNFIFSTCVYRDQLYLGTHQGNIFRSDGFSVNLEGPVYCIFSDGDHLYANSKTIHIIEGREVINTNFNLSYFNYAFNHDSTLFLNSRYRNYRITNLYKECYTVPLKPPEAFEIDSSYFFDILGPDKTGEFYGFNVNLGKIQSCSNQEELFESGNKKIKGVIQSSSGHNKFYLLTNKAELFEVDFTEEKLILKYRFKQLNPEKVAISNDCIWGYQHGILEGCKLNEPEQNWVYDKYNFTAKSELIDIRIVGSHLHLVLNDAMHNIPLEHLFDSTSYVSQPILINGREGMKMSFTQKDVLSFNLNHFDALNGQNLVAKYRINGGEWMKQSISEKLVLQNLGAGEYALELEIYRYGNDLVARKDISFTIEPYWYQTTLFYVFMVGLFSILLFFFFRWRIQNLRKKQQQELLLVQAQLSAINAQMKPHFLFNSLNSIQNTILQEDKFKASERLSEFSSFIRKTLDFSRLSSISLEEELTVIDEYVCFELYRFRNKFTFQLNNQLEPALCKTLIPPFILQPFVENAIVHGVSHLEENGKIELTLCSHKDWIVCDIVDNGIGVERSVLLNKNRKKHRSFAVEANFDRISLLKDGTVTTSSSEHGTHVQVKFKPV